MLFSLIDVFMGYPLYLSLTSGCSICFPLEASEYSRNLECGLGVCFFLRAVVHCGQVIKYLLLSIYHFCMLGHIVVESTMLDLTFPLQLQPWASFLCFNFLNLKEGIMGVFFIGFGESKMS